MDKEHDPAGLSPKQPGAKLDAGKPKAAQILGMFAHALWEVSRVGTFGAGKYSMGGWQHVDDGENRYADAGMRHFLKKWMGEEEDSDSELLHLSHEAWNSLAKLELYLRGKKDKTGPIYGTRFCRRHGDVKDTEPAIVEEAMIHSYPDSRAWPLPGTCASLKVKP